MKLSKKAYYGLRATLALAASPRALSLQELAAQEAIPAPYLEKILQVLRKDGIVTATRGATGGYRLTNADTSAWQVIAALDGPLKIFAPVKGTLPCLQITHCQANVIFRDIETALEDTLKKTLLAPKNT